MGGFGDPVRAADVGALKRPRPRAQLDVAMRVVPSPALSLEPRRCRRCNGRGHGSEEENCVIYLLRIGGIPSQVWR